MFTLTYYIIALFIYIVGSFFLLLISIFNKKYSLSIPARFFLYRNPPLKSGGIWFHACSFGEVNSLKTIIDKLDKDSIHITTTTNTGFNEAKNSVESYRFLPFEIFLPFWITKQKILVVTEAELWYMLFLTAKKKGIKTILINARVSDKSYKNYLKFSFLYKKIFENIDIVFAQSNRDRERLLTLGAKNIIVNGNIKASSDVKVTKKYQKPNREVVTLASTHENEEELILSAIDSFKGRKIFIVPRHPERFKKVDILLQKFAKERKLSYNKFSNSLSFEEDITLIDKMGELINIYAISDVVLLGGSFVDKIGGHNPIEAAFFNCKIISGKYYFNQKSLYPLVENIKIIDIKSLSNLFKNIDKIQYSKILNKGDIYPILKELKTDENINCK